MNCPHCHSTQLSHLRRTTNLGYVVFRCQSLGATLYVQTGGLDFGVPSQPSFEKLRDSMDKAGLPYEHWHAAEAIAHFPQFKLEPGMEALDQANTGLLGLVQN